MSPICVSISPIVTCLWSQILVYCHVTVSTVMNFLSKQLRSDCLKQELCSYYLFSVSCDTEILLHCSTLYWMVHLHQQLEHQEHEGSVNLLVLHFCDHCLCMLAGNKNRNRQVFIITWVWQWTFSDLGTCLTSPWGGGGGRQTGSSPWPHFLQRNIFSDWLHL